MPIDRNMRLVNDRPEGIAVGDLIDAIAAEIVPAVMAQVEQAVLADLRTMLAQASTNQARPTK